jgi:hypothetical protein
MRPAHSIAAVATRPVRTITTIVFAAAVAVTGCTAHPTATGPSVASAPPGDPTGSAPAPADRQAAIYTTVLRQYLTSGHGHFGGDSGFGGYRFPRIFVLDHADASAGPSTPAATATAARRTITETLADVGPVTFVPSPDAVIDRDRCARVREDGILITLGPLAEVGDRVSVNIYGFVACLGASSVTYRVGWTGDGWVVRETIPGPVS